MRVRLLTHCRSLRRPGTAALVGGNLAAAWIATATLLLPGSGDAAVYDPGPILFETYGQSMWGTGSTTSVSNSAFIGTTWSGGFGPIGGIIGNESTRVPGTGGTLVADNPLWAIWNACNNSIFKSVCGSQPSRTIRVSNPIPAKFVDTRSGATLEASTSGKAGFNLSYAFDSGDVDAAVSYDALLQLPDSVTPGERFYLNPTSSLATVQSLSTAFPDATAKIEGVLQADANFSGMACATLFGCLGGSGGLSINETFEIISVNDPVSSPGKISILGTADPAAFQFGEKIELGGPLTNVGNVTVSIPNLDTSGALRSDGKIVSGGESSFIDLRADLDGLASLAVGLPTILGASLDLGPLSVSYDLVDVEAGPDIRIVQDFELTPTLMVALEFDRAVEIEGVGTTTQYSGAWSELPGVTLLGDGADITITPNFFVQAVLKNTTRLAIAGTFTVDALAGGASATVGPASISLGGFGPVFSFSDSSAALELPPVYDESFLLSGFNTAGGISFTLGSSGPSLLADASGDVAAELTTGSPVSITQTVENPGTAFTLEFDYRFVTGGGTLDILLDGFSILSTLLASPGGAMADFAHFSQDIDLVALGINLFDPMVALEFLFNDIVAGSVLQLDNIIFPSLLNGDFQTGGTDNWRPSQTGQVGTLVSLPDSFSTVPEPAGVLFLLLALTAFGLFRISPARVMA